jgi:hypothetical protein
LFGMPLISHFRSNFEVVIPDSGGRDDVFVFRSLNNGRILTGEGSCSRVLVDVAFYVELARFFVDSPIVADLEVHRISEESCARIYRSADLDLMGRIPISPF